MDSTAWIALAIFMVVYVFIVSEKIHRTVIALTGAMLMIVCGILTQEMAIHHIDFNTIGLLAGMMVVVNITGETGLFNYLAVWAAKKVKAEPLKLLVALSFLTAICSAFLDNVTTVLLTVPLLLLLIHLSRWIGRNRRNQIISRKSIRNNSRRLNKYNNAHFMAKCNSFCIY